MPKFRLKQNNGWQFVELEDLIKLWISRDYSDDFVIVLYRCKRFFEEIPRLNMLKRDNFKTFKRGTKADFGFLTFDTKEKAADFALGLPDKNAQLIWELYIDGKLHMISGV